MENIILNIGQDEPISLNFKESENISLNIKESDPITLELDGITSFQGLTDTPNLIEADKFLKGNTAGDAFEFVSSGDLIDWGDVGGLLLNQTDLQNALDLKYDSADFSTDFDVRFIFKSIGDLSDIDLTGLSDGEVLKYNSTSGNFEPSSDIDTDELVKVTANDTTPGYLGLKIKDGLGVNVQLVNAGANEELYLNAVPGEINHQELLGAGTSTHAQIDSHIANISNPHLVTKIQIGLGNVDNTSDLNKPISTATQNALDLKENILKSITTKTGNYVIDSNDYTILLDGSSNSVTVTLPTAAGITGKIYNIKSINSTNLTDIATNGSEEMDNDSSNFELIKDEVVTIQSDGANWWII